MLKLINGDPEISNRLDFESLTLGQSTEIHSQSLHQSMTSLTKS